VLDVGKTSVGMSGNAATEDPQTRDTKRAVVERRMENVEKHVCIENLKSKKPPINIMPVYVDLA
jgi:hypothetical protein